MSLRKSINKFLSITGFEILHSNSVVLKSQTSFKVDFDFLIQNEIEKAGGNFYFVQIGANDGSSRSDDLMPFIQKYSIAGTMVEPQPDVFNVLSNNYKDFPQINLVNKAIHNTEKSMKFYRFDLDKLRLQSNLPHWALTNGIASFEYEHVAKHAKKLNLPLSAIETIQVQCISLSDLFDEFNLVPNLLKIDVEGYDYYLLMDLNLDKGKPKLIRFEHLHLPKNQYAELIDKFKKYGYKFVVTKADTICILCST